MMQSNFKITIYSVISVSLIIGGIAMAGQIINTNFPTPSPYTLNDIYNKLTDPNYNVNPTHSLSPTVSTSTPTMRSLGDIYTAVPIQQVLNNSTTTFPAGIYGTTTLSSTETNLRPENIASGTVMFGITGTYNCVP